MPRLLGQKLRLARLQKQLNQSELAVQLGGVSQSHIAKVEAGEDAPSLALVVRAAAILAVSADYLLRDSLPVDQLRPQQPPPPKNEATPSFGTYLRVLREQRGWSQRDLAQRLGLASRAYVGGLETNPQKLPSIELVVKMADLFGVATDDLLAGVGE